VASVDRKLGTLFTAAKSTSVVEPLIIPAIRGRDGFVVSRLAVGVPSLRDDPQVEIDSAS